MVNLMNPFAMYPSLKEKIVLITGGATGIGASIVEHFCAQGSRVAFIGRNEAAAADLKKRMIASGYIEPLFICADLSALDAINDAVHAIQQHFGDVDVLINNAANDERMEALDITESQWDAFMNINLRHQFFMAQAVLPQMIKSKAGSIVNMSSNCFLLSRIPHYACYATAKAGIVGMTRSLAVEFGGYGIRVNCVMPGWVMTDRQIQKWLTPESEEVLMEEQALKEKLYPPDVARMVLFLSADDSRLISKQCFIIDGGRA